MKRNPTGVRWAGGSKGSVDHISVIEIAQTQGIAPDKVNYSPMGGGGETNAALLGGHVSHREVAQRRIPRQREHAAVDHDGAGLASVIAAQLADEVCRDVSAGGAGRQGGGDGW